MRLHDNRLKLRYPPFGLILMRWNDSETGETGALTSQRCIPTTTFVNSVSAHDEKHQNTGSRHSANLDRWPT